MKRWNFHLRLSAKRILFYFRPYLDRFRARSRAVHDERAEGTCPWRGLCSKTWNPPRMEVETLWVSTQKKHISFRKKCDSVEGVIYSNASKRFLLRNTPLSTPTITTHCCMKDAFQTSWCMKKMPLIERERVYYRLSARGANSDYERKNSWKSGGLPLIHNSRCCS